MTRKQRYHQYLASDHWTNLKVEKFALNGHRLCECCSSPTQPSVHHINYRNLIDCTVNDLVVLCRQCHEVFHTACKFYGDPPAGKPLHEIVMQISIFVDDPSAPYWVRKLKDSVNIREFAIGSVQVCTNKYFTSNQTADDLDQLIQDLVKLKEGQLFSVTSPQMS